ncbi:MAG: glycosyltransferase [Lentisphaeria bacterium]|nr:glycosyltransferase [Lentisphaeria bacterium]
MGMGSTAVSFSVLVPVYNGGDLLRRCVDSVLRQSFRDFELVLCDDKSTDGSLALMREYAADDVRVRILEHPENRGRTAAHCTLNQAAARPYSICMDADDEIAPDFLETGAAILREEKYDVLDFPCELRFPDGTTRFSPGEARTCRGDNMLMTHLKNSLGTWWSKIYRTEILRNTEPLTRENLSLDDVFFMAPLYYQVKSYRYVRTEHPMYIYYGNVGSWSRSMFEMDPERFDKRCRLGYETTRLNIEFYQKHGFGQEYEDAVLQLYTLNDLLLILKMNPAWRREGIAIFRRYFLKDGNLLSDGSVAAPRQAAHYEAQLRQLETPPAKRPTYTWNL